MRMSEQEELGPLAKLREAAHKNEGTAKLADAFEGYLSAKARDVVDNASKTIGRTVEHLTGGGEGGTLATGMGKIAKGEGPVKGAAAAAGQGIKDKAKNLVGGMGGGGSDGASNKSVKIVEDIDVGVPVRIAYDQWTRFSDFGDFAQGVEGVEEEDEITTKWRGKILWSNRSWTGTVTEQIPDRKIAWTSEGSKGTTEGVVTFHPLVENLTKILLVTQYYPQGFVERTANLWRAQGRRLRLDLKRYRTYLMMLAEEEAQEVEGWRGEIRDSEVVLSHEEATEEDAADSEEVGEEEDHPDDEDEEAEGAEER